MIAIIGRGNVASHLYEALKRHTEVCLVNPRTLEGLPADADVVLVSVSDDAIKEVAEKLPRGNAIIAHTSGSVPMSALEGAGEKIGVFYPLQTFTKGVDMDYSEIPVFIEGSSPQVSETLKNLAAKFSENVREADSATRKQLHLASVFSCNFTNALADIADGLLSETGLDISVLVPLMKRTVDKLRFLSPKESQTGPAVRGDKKVIEEHLRMLEAKPELRELYARLSDMIISRHKPKQNPT